MGGNRVRKSVFLRKTSSPRSKRRIKPISNNPRSLFRVALGALGTLLRGKNFRIVAGKIHQSQITFATRLRQRSSAFRLAGWARKYAATLVVAFCVLLVALLNIASTQNLSGTPFGFFTEEKVDPTEALRNKIAIENSKKNNLAAVPLFSAEPPAFSSEASGRENYLYESADSLFEPAPSIDSQIVLAVSGPGALTSSKSRGVRTYEVRNGDTAGSIAAAHGVTTNTILWANNLSETSMIKPGDKLSILPVTGVKYKVQKSDSLDAIAQKYNADKGKIITYNQLTADEKLKEGQELIVPDGFVSPAPAQTATGTQLATASGTTGYASRPAAATGSYKMDSRAGGGHRFPYGYCTWYVAQRKYVPWGGNAGAWLTNARASGRSTGRAPQAGAIIVTGESRWGHVGIVEKVSGNSVTISEMNYAGFGKKSTRTISASSRVIKGFIY